MFHLVVSKAESRLLEHQIIASSAVNVYPVKFDFDESWDGFSRTAIFKTDTSLHYRVILNSEGECYVPWEVCQNTYDGEKLFVGLSGNKDGAVQTTVWKQISVVASGAYGGCDIRQPTPSVYDKIMADYAQILDETADIKDAAALIIESRAQSFEIDPDGHLIVNKESGESDDLGRVVGDDGLDGFTPTVTVTNPYPGLCVIRVAGEDSTTTATIERGVDYWTSSDQNAIVQTVSGSFVEFTNAEVDALWGGETE